MKTHPRALQFLTDATYKGRSFVHVASGADAIAIAKEVGAGLYVGPAAGDPSVCTVMTPRGAVTALKRGRTVWIPTAGTIPLT